MRKEEYRDYFHRLATMSQFMLAEGNKTPNELWNHLWEVADEGPNPSRDVIPADGSVLLEMGEVPFCFHTPFGTFQFAASHHTVDHAQRQRMNEMLKERFGLVQVAPAKAGEQGHAPLYAVTKDFDGKPFPKPKRPIKHITLDRDQQAYRKKLWKEVSFDPEEIEARFPREPAVLRPVDRAIAEIEARTGKWWESTPEPKGPRGIVPPLADAALPIAAETPPATHLDDVHIEPVLPAVARAATR